MSIKNAAKARNWTDDETGRLCEILVDPINEFLQTFEYKALKNINSSSTVLPSCC